MYPVLLTVHVLVGVLLILSVMIQSGRSGGFSNLMGGGGGDALFSTSGQQSGLRKITMILAGVFMATSIGLTSLSARQTNQSVFQRNFPALPPVNVPTPATPAAVPAGPAGMPQVTEQAPISAPQNLDTKPVKK